MTCTFRLVCAVLAAVAGLFPAVPAHADQGLDRFARDFSMWLTATTSSRLRLRVRMYASVRTMPPEMCRAFVLARLRSLRSCCSANSRWVKMMAVFASRAKNVCVPSQWTGGSPG